MTGACAAPGLGPSLEHEEAADGADVPREASTPLRSSVGLDTISSLQRSLERISKESGEPAQ